VKAEPDNLQAMRDLAYVVYRLGVADGRLADLLPAALAPALRLSAAYHAAECLRM